jgi:hypothetical protein
MKSQGILIIATLFLIVFLSCSSTKEMESTIKKISGMSAMVGNEPFVQIAIIVYPNDVYIIKGPEKVHKLLYDNQGKYVQIEFNGIKDSANVHVINALSAKVL